MRGCQLTSDEPKNELPNDGGQAGISAGIQPITEKQLAQLWERRAARSAALHTDRGARVRVLYPGRPGVTAGPDFRDAALLVEGVGLVQGDVEVHLRQRDWNAHGHQHDPNYNGVALHVALATDSATAVTSSGVIPPVAALDGLVAAAANDDDGVCGPDGTDADAGVDPATQQRLWALLAAQDYRRPTSPDEMAALLNRAGDARFLWRSRLLSKWLAAQTGEQTLWESIGQALGYRHNQHAMQELAGRAPIAVLADAARRIDDPAERAAALTDWLLRWAGFAPDQSPAASPSQSPTPSIDQSVGMRHHPPGGMGPALDAGAWRLFRVRPSNHPRRRVMAAAALANRYCESGLSVGIYRAALTGKPAALTAALAIPDAPDGKTALIGTGRARDIAVNAALPYLHAWRLSAGDAAGAQAMLRLYREYGPLPDNEIIRQTARALCPPEWGKVANSARRQQGLLHLQRLLAGANPRAG